MEGWRHFRGEQEKPSLEEVLEVFRKKGIDSGAKYKRQRATDPELQNIPVSMKVYKKEGWKGWPHFRGESRASKILVPLSVKC